MSFRSSLESLRLGNLGLVSVGIVAFALATLQGCAPSTVTASSAREPGGPSIGVAAAHGDVPVRASERYVADRPATDRAATRVREGLTSHHDFCRRCSN